MFSNQKTMAAEDSELGKKSEYVTSYDPELLFAIPRKSKRDEIAVPEILPFYGFDLWNHYEVSWLNEKGKPVVAIAEIIYGCETPKLIESKSMKLYFNSFNQTVFKNHQVLKKIIEKDIAERVGGVVQAHLWTLPFKKPETLAPGFLAECLDELDVTCKAYTIDRHFLTVSEEIIEESLYSNLLKSNCLVTNQPDWGSVFISYKGKKINHAGLLQYIVSFRNHNEFHEQCIERIFIDIMTRCQPEHLTVYGRYTRRGGIDINPYRSTHAPALTNQRLIRQ